MSVLIRKPVSSTVTFGLEVCANVPFVVGDVTATSGSFTQLSASLGINANGYAIIEAVCFNDSGATAVSLSFATGAPGSEVVIGSYRIPHSSGSINEGFVLMLNPALFVPASTRLSVTSSVTPTGLTGVGVTVLALSSPAVLV